MAGGTLFISAAGAALGATQGGVISNNYIGNIKDFRIRKIKEGVGPAVIFINGFLSQKNQDSSDWEKGVYKNFPSTVWTSPPIGLDTISYQCDGIYNYDVSNMVNGHMEYKNNLNVLLNLIK